MATSISNDDEVIRAAGALLHKTMRDLRALGLPPALFDAAAEGAYKKYRKVLNPFTFRTLGPRDEKERLGGKPATTKYGRLEYIHIIKDEAQYKAVLFLLLNENKVWIPRSQIDTIEQYENVVLVSRWWLNKNLYQIDGGKNGP